MLENKKIAVLGAGGLLGKSIVTSALQEGAQVVAADIDIDAMRQKLADSGVDISCGALSMCSLDVTEEKDVKKFFYEQEGLTGVVNSTYPRNKTYGAHFFDVSLDSFNENLSLHLGSTFLLNQQSATYFQENQSEFSLVNISSIYGAIAPKFDVYDGTAMTVPVEYAAIKSAIIHLNKYVAAYVNDSRFRVNSISPGGILDSQPQDFLKAYKKHTLGKGMLQEDDVVGSVLFLLSDHSTFVNGQNIVVDGGFSL